MPPPRCPYRADELVRDVDHHERPAIEVVNGGEKSRPNVDLVLRHGDGQVRVVKVVSYLS